MAHSKSAAADPPRLSAVSARAYWRLWVGARAFEQREHLALIADVAALDAELRAMPAGLAGACLTRLAAAIARGVGTSA
ncbi:MAG: hypothetical protein ACRD2F_00140 [Terriglobales bacterium]